jgi:hypothetical protein
MPKFTLGPKGYPTDVSADPHEPSGGRAPVVVSKDLGGTGIQDLEPVTPDAGGFVTGGNADPYGGAHSTRRFERTYSESPGVQTPFGLMNTGYVHNVVSTNGQWSRGELPDLGYGYAFALRRPKFMREPRTDLGSYNLARG